ncbi:MAG: multidrug efflux MFS transporter [Bauldia sp.]|nr:multidrug efflux MFS transporter [Bauldia sp.]
MTVDAAAMPASAPAQPEAETTVSRENLTVIYLLIVSAFVVILNETIMAVALPHLMDDLGASASAAQWLTTAFLLTMAVVIPITGFLIQRINTRPIFILAMSLFSLGTAIAAVAPGLPVLVFARVVQAVGTAIMMPLLMTTVMTLVPPAARGKMMGNISIVISVAPALGPTLSGLILNYLSWRFLFIIVLPIALGGLALGYARLRNVTTTRYAPLDILSVILSIFAFAGLVYGLSSFGEAGPALVIGGTAIPDWVVLAFGLVTMGVFVMRQIALQAADKPLLDFRTFASRDFTVSVGMFVVMMMAMFGTIILLPIYMQNVRALTTLQTGLLLLPGGLLMGLLGPYVGRLYDKVGPRPLVVPGAIAVSAVLWAMTRLGPETPVPFILAGHLVFSLGLAFLFTPLFTSSLGAVKPQLYSHASAILGSTQQVAGAAGVALFIAVMSLQTASRTAAGASPVEALAGGIQVAFTIGAVISLFAIATAFFVRKPADQSGGMAHGH